MARDDRAAHRALTAFVFTRRTSGRIVDPAPPVAGDAPASPATMAAPSPATAAAPPGGRMARHVAWNLLAVALPFSVGLLTIPVLTRALGPARFGLIGLAWAILEYLAVFDAGLNRATVHFVARELRGRARIPGRVVLQSLAVQVLLGALAGGALALGARWLASSVLHVPPALHEETRRSLLVLGATVPLAMLALGVRGLLEAAERFDVVAAIRIPSTAATFVVPAIAAAAGASVPQILLALLVLRAVTCLVTALLVPRFVPRIAWRERGTPGQLRQVAAFGGWVAVSNVLSPIFLLLDRATLAVIAGVAAVGYYTGPYEAVARLLVIPAALVTAIFPRVSALAAAHAAGRGQAELIALYTVAVRGLAIALAGGIAVAIALAPDLVGAWLGAEYATRAATAMRLLLIGVLANALAHVPFAFVQALGRPDLTARFHVAELLVHVPVTILLVREWGVAGAAGAWMIRALLDAVLVSAAAHRLLGLRVRAIFARQWWRFAAVLAATAGAAVVLQRSTDVATGGRWTLFAAAAGIAALYGAVAWRFLLDPRDRAALGGMLRAAR